MDSDTKDDGEAACSSSLGNGGSCGDQEEGNGSEGCDVGFELKRSPDSTKLNMHGAEENKKEMVETRDQDVTTGKSKVGVLVLDSEGDMGKFRVDDEIANTKDPTECSEVLGMTELPHREDDLRGQTSSTTAEEGRLGGPDNTRSARAPAESSSERSVTDEDTKTRKALKCGKRPPNRAQRTCTELTTRSDMNTEQTQEKTAEIIEEGSEVGISTAVAGPSQGCGTSSGCTYWSPDDPEWKIRQILEKHGSHDSTISVHDGSDSDSDSSSVGMSPRSPRESSTGYPYGLWQGNSAPPLTARDYELLMREAAKVIDQWPNTSRAHRNDHSVRLELEGIDALQRLLLPPGCCGNLPAIHHEFLRRFFTNPYMYFTSEPQEAMIPAGHPQLKQSQEQQVENIQGTRRRNATPAVEVAPIIIPRLFADDTMFYVEDRSPHSNLRLFPKPLATNHSDDTIQKSISAQSLEEEDYFSDFDDEDRPPGKLRRILRERNPRDLDILDGICPDRRAQRSNSQHHSFDYPYNQHFASQSSADSDPSWYYNSDTTAEYEPDIGPGSDDVEYRVFSCARPTTDDINLSFMFDGSPWINRPVRMEGGLHFGRYLPTDEVFNPPPETIADMIFAGERAFTQELLLLKAVRCNCFRNKNEEQHMWFGLQDRAIFATMRRCASDSLLSYDGARSCNVVGNIKPYYTPRTKKNHIAGQRQDSDGVSGGGKSSDTQKQKRSRTKDPLGSSSEDDEEDDDDHQDDDGAGGVSKNQKKQSTGESQYLSLEESQLGRSDDSQTELDDSAVNQHGSTSPAPNLSLSRSRNMPRRTRLKKSSQMHCDRTDKLVETTKSSPVLNRKQELHHLDYSRGQTHLIPMLRMKELRATRSDSCMSGLLLEDNEIRPYMLMAQQNLELDHEMENNQFADVGAEEEYDIEDIIEPYDDEAYETQVAVGTYTQTFHNPAFGFEDEEIDTPQPDENAMPILYEIEGNGVYHAPAAGDGGIYIAEDNDAPNPEVNIGPPGQQIAYEDFDDGDNSQRIGLLPNHPYVNFDGSTLFEDHDDGQSQAEQDDDSLMDIHEDLDSLDTCNDELQRLQHEQYELLASQQNGRLEIPTCTCAYPLRRSMSVPARFDVPNYWRGPSPNNYSPFRLLQNPLVMYVNVLHEDTHRTYENIRDHVMQVQHGLQESTLSTSQNDENDEVEQEPTDDRPYRFSADNWSSIVYSNRYLLSNTAYPVASTPDMNKVKKYDEGHERGVWRGASRSRSFTHVEEYWDRDNAPSDVQVSAPFRQRLEKAVSELNVMQASSSSPDAEGLPDVYPLGDSNSSSNSSINSINSGRDGDKLGPRENTGGEAELDEDKMLDSDKCPLEGPDGRGKQN